MLNFAEREKEILDYWKVNNTFQKSLDKKSPQGDYVFYEGPPTANGKPGVHHILARIFKDVICRYKTMQGFRVPRKAGWDTHGLPVEIEVEKAIGTRGKQDIEKFGIEEFNKKCRASVWQYKRDFEQLTERIGYWVDMENPYITYENDYIESVWSILKLAWDRKLLYQGNRITPHCPRCGTSLSSHELAQGYKDTTEPSFYVKFRVSKSNDIVQAGDYILSWTTTPWTLPGNVALAIGADIDYVRATRSKQAFDEKNPKESEVINEDEVYIVAKELAEEVLGEHYKVESAFKGKDIIGIDYDPLYDIPAVKKTGKRSHYVAAADFVNIEDGTGIVHTAVVYGEDDYRLGEELDLPMVPLLDHSGIFNELAPKQLQGMAFKEGEEMVLLNLTESGLFYRKKDYTHAYPFCWRCDSPVIYMAKKAWYIKMTALREQLLQNAQQINWYPGHLKAGRFGEWLEGVKDWAVSRERYWGTPLPVWQCQKCLTNKVIGSLAELETNLVDVHRPFIDTVIFQCDCGGEMKRVPEVIDAWFDSGSMPFAQLHYPFENKEMIDEGIAYPAAYISEAIDQTRGWFYTLLAVSTIMDKGASYKNVICLGHINDATGKKMSKSRGNAVDPWIILNKYGTDTLRYHLFTINQPGEPKNFEEKNVIAVHRQVIMTLINVLSFYALYNEKADQAKPDSDHPMDRWIRARLQLCSKNITGHMEVYAVTDAAREIGDFVNELSTWYVRRSRSRFKDETMRPAAIGTMKLVLTDLAKVMAPFMPFASEHVWLAVKAEETNSVHLAQWPILDATIDETVLKSMQQVRAVIEKAHALRSLAGIKVRQPLSTLDIIDSLQDDFLGIIAEEVNVKDVVVVKKITASKTKVIDDHKTVGLETALTDALKSAGALRELIRATNQQRKLAGLKPSDRMIIHYTTDSTYLKDSVIGQYRQRLAQQTAAEDWVATDKLSGEPCVLDINGEAISISL